MRYRVEVVAEAKCGCSDSCKVYYFDVPVLCGEKIVPRPLAGMYWYPPEPMLACGELYHFLQANPEAAFVIQEWILNNPQYGFSPKWEWRR